MAQEHISLEKSLTESVPENLSQPESLPHPEKQEQKPEQKPEHKDKKEKLKSDEPTIPAKSVINITNDQSRKEIQKKQIDDILSFGLSDIFLDLEPAKQQEFKKTGEVTVSKINALLNKANVNINKIVHLIKKWLGILPNANKYYLEQEAKIKADKIIQIKR